MADDILQGRTVIEGFSPDNSDGFGYSDGTEKQAPVKGGVTDGGHSGWNDGVLAPYDKCSGRGFDEGVAAFT